MIEIKLTNGKVAMVDDEDFDLVSKHRWYYAPRHINEYAVTSIKIDGERKAIKMHRLILACN